MREGSNKPVLEHLPRINIKTLYRYADLKEWYQSRREGNRIKDIGRASWPNGLSMRLRLEVDAEALFLCLGLSIDEDQFSGHYTRIRIVGQAVHFGGERLYFKCPCCGKSVKLIAVNGFIGCRHCLGTRYYCENKSMLDRKIERMRSIFKRYGFSYQGRALEISSYDSEVLKFGALPEYWRPKGMHFKTFYRIRDQLRRLNQERDRGTEIMMMNTFRRIRRGRAF